MLVEVEEIIVDLLLMPKMYIHIKWRQYSRKEQTKHQDLISYVVILNDKNEQHPPQQQSSRIGHVCNNNNSCRHSKQEQVTTEKQQSIFEIKVSKLVLNFLYFNNNNIYFIISDLQ